MKALVTLVTLVAMVAALAFAGTALADVEHPAAHPHGASISSSARPHADWDPQALARPYADWNPDKL